MVVLVEQSFPEVWNELQTTFEKNFLTQQDFFKQVAGSAAFLPEPSQVATDEFWKKCVRHDLPTVQMQALSDLAPLLGKDAALKTLVLAFELEQLKYKAAEILAMAPDVKVLTSSTQMAKEIECMSKDLAVMAGLFCNHEGLDYVKDYLTNHVMSSFMGVCKVLMEKASAAEQAIPQNYARVIEARDIQQIKTVLFARRLHETVCGSLVDFVSLGSSLTAVCKTAGHLMTAPQLLQVKMFQGALKALRGYAGTIQVVNLILVKFPTKDTRAKSALGREFRKTCEKSGVCPLPAALKWLEEAAK